MRLLTGLVVMMLLFAACMGGNDDDSDSADTAPTQTSTPTSTSTPESSDADDEPEATSTSTSTSEPTTTPTDAPTSTPEEEPTEEPTATTEPSPTATMTQEPTVAEETPTVAEPTAVEDDEPEETTREDELASSLLLELPDMPTEFSVAQEFTGDRDDSDELGVCDSESIEDQMPASGRAERSFEAGNFGPFVSQLIVLYDSEDRSRAAMQLYRDAIDCEEWTAVEDGEEVTWRLSPLSFDSYGDDTHAVRFNVEISGFSFEGEMVAVQSGRGLTLIQNFAVGAADTGITTQAIEIAVTKLEAGI